MQQSDAAALPLADDTPRAPLVRWLAINLTRLTIYLAIADFGTSLVGALAEVG